MHVMEAGSNGSTEEGMDFMITDGQPHLHIGELQML